MVFLVASLTPANLARRLGLAAIARLGRLGMTVLRALRAREQTKPEESMAVEEIPPANPPVQTPQEIINPTGKPIGRPGNKSTVREMSGGDKAAQELYDKLSKGGEPYKPAKYPPEAKGTKLPDGSWVGYRPSSKSGPPTVDIHIDGVPFDKIKFP